LQARGYKIVSRCLVGVELFIVNEPIIRELRELPGIADAEIDLALLRKRETGSVVLGAEVFIRRKEQGAVCDVLILDNETALVAIQGRSEDCESGDFGGNSLKDSTLLGRSRSRSSWSPSVFLRSEISISLIIRLCCSTLTIYALNPSALPINLCTHNGASQPIAILRLRLS
jgi:hypothetical protein